MSWTHIKALIHTDDPLKREFYHELCQLERWSSRRLQERMNSVLFERSAISRKPAEAIRHDLAQLRQEQRVQPDVLLKDPYVLDFLGLNDRYLEKDLEDATPREMEQFLLELAPALRLWLVRSGYRSTTTISTSTRCFITASLSGWWP